MSNSFPKNNPKSNFKSNPKSKVQKRSDKSVQLTLAAVCEQAQGEMTGLQRLTHQANYSDFPASLLISCVFNTEDECLQAEQLGHTHTLQKLIQNRLLKIGVKLSAIDRQISFETEESRNIDTLK